MQMLNSDKMKILKWSGLQRYLQGTVIRIQRLYPILVFQLLFRLSTLSSFRDVRLPLQQSALHIRR